MTKNFTINERYVAEQLASDALNYVNDNIDQSADWYMLPIAQFVLRDKLDDAAFAALGRELLQQYQKDTLVMVLIDKKEMDDAVAYAEAETRYFMKNKTV